MAQAKSGTTAKRIVAEKRIVADAPSDLHKALKAFAAQQDVTIETIVLGLVEQYLREHNALPARFTSHSDHLAQTA